MQVLAGTSGYAYKEWKGSFYPQGLPAKDMLRYYAQRLQTVEINNTFYRIPSEKVLLQWREQVSEGFRFVLKASRRITHLQRLKNVREPLLLFLQNASVLEEKLGPVLYQLPPDFKKDLPRLEEFLGLLPAGARAALEFRHASWFDAEVFEALKRHNAALCLADTDEESAPDVITADWGYLRLRRQEYSGSDLSRWAIWTRAQPWQEAYVFFKHEDEGSGPRLAMEFLSLVLTE